jgi:hypothetical protein
MSPRKKRHLETESSASAAEFQEANEKIIRETTEKYRELYLYATDILLKEHERFNRADDKASKYTTMFVFLIGVAIYFDKWIFGSLKWPEFPVRLSPTGQAVTPSVISSIMTAITIAI